MVRPLEVTPARAIERLQDDLRLSTSELAGALGASPRTVKRWLEGETHPQRDARRRLADLNALHHRLCDTFGAPEARRVWLRASNRHLGGLAPADAMRAGRVDRVDATLEALDSGVYV